jgi:hypothetical protein
MGHISKDCRLPKKDRSNKNANLSMKTEKDQAINKEDIVFHISEKHKNIKNVWILDSGATNHNCCDKDMFEILKKYSSTVKVGDGRKLQVKGFGQIECDIITNDNKKKLNITEVLFVPDLSTNLISIGILSKKGFEITFKEDKCIIKRNNGVITEGTKCKHNSNL